MDNKTFEAIVFFGMCAVLIAFGIYAALQGDEREAQRKRRNGKSAR